LCFDRATGKILWQQTVVYGPLEKINRENSYASGTPATDDQRVYVNFCVGDKIVVAAHDGLPDVIARIRIAQVYIDRRVMPRDGAWPTARYGLLRKRSARRAAVPRRQSPARRCWSLQRSYSQSQPSANA
jgi:hypothetical protein